MDSTFKVLHFFEIIVDGLLLDLKSCSGGLGVLQLSLLELEVVLHLINLSGSGQLVLSSHVSLHVLKEGGNQCLVLLDFFFVLSLLHLKLLSELVDFLFLLIEDFILLLFTALRIFLSEILIDFFDVLLVGFDHLLHFDNFFVHLLDFGIVLLDTVLKSLSSLWQWQVHFIGLKLEILLLLSEHSPLLLQVLSSLLKSILSQS